MTSRTSVCATWCQPASDWVTDTSASEAGLTDMAHRMALSPARENIVVTATAPGASASEMNKGAGDYVVGSTQVVDGGFTHARGAVGGMGTQASAV